MRPDYPKGAIVAVDLGQPPKAIKGHEQAFIRPGVVIKSFQRLELPIVLPLTSKVPKYGRYTIVKIAKGQGGLTANSYVLCHPIRTVSFDRILRQRGALGTRDMGKINAVLIDTLEL